VSKHLLHRVAIDNNDYIHGKLLRLLLFSLVAGEKTCPQSCCLATTVVLSPVYTAVTWQWVYISQYILIYTYLLDVQYIVKPK
jgi:hypothetical protein